MGFGGPGEGTGIDTTGYYEQRRDQIDGNWTSLIPGATPYEQLGFVRREDPFNPGAEEGNIYYQLQVLQPEEREGVSYYQRTNEDDPDRLVYDQQAYLKTLYDDSADLGQGYFIDREERERDDAGDFMGYDYVLAQQEGYEALAPDYSRYYEGRYADTGTADTDTGTDTGTVGNRPEDPPDDDGLEPPTTPSAPVTRVQPRTPYAGLEVDDEERGRPRRGRRRSRTIMTSGLIGNQPVQRKTLLGS